MKPIIINETNEKKITTMLNTAQARARERLITYKDLIGAARQIESKLGITKKALEGTKADIDMHARNFPNSYKGRPESTQVKIIFSGGKWRLLSVSRQFTRRYSQKYKIDLSDPGKAAILDNASRLA